MIWSKGTSPYQMFLFFSGFSGMVGIESRFFFPGCVGETCFILSGFAFYQVLHLIRFCILSCFARAC